MTRLFVAAVLATILAATLSAPGAMAAPVSAPMQSDSSVPISVATATTVELVPAVAGQSIFVTHYNIVAAGTGSVKLVSGTGTNCGTGTADVTGNYALTASAAVEAGSGLGVLVIVAPGRALCVTNSAAVGMYGLLSFAQR
jgi:hypothetical protein